MRKRFDTARDAVAAVLLTVAVIAFPLIVVAHAPASEEPKNAIKEEVITEETEPVVYSVEVKTVSDEEVEPIEDTSERVTTEPVTESQPEPVEIETQFPEPEVYEPAYSEPIAEPAPEQATVIETPEAGEASLYPPDDVSYENPWYFGLCRCTAYCSCPMCCDNLTTHTGTTVTEGRTVAVDPNYIPFGSHLIINGHEYIAEDSGGAIKERCIDIYFDTHEECVNFGLQYLDVYVVSVGDGSVYW